MKRTEKSCHFVEKGWGWELWLANFDFANITQGDHNPNQGYCGKKMSLYHGKKCSWHYHKEKQESFYILDGEMRVLYGIDDDIKKAKEVILTPGDVFDVHNGLRHRFIGHSKTDCIFFEFSTFHKDEDSYRIEKGD